MNSLPVRVIANYQNLPIAFYDYFSTAGKLIQQNATFFAAVQKRNKKIPARTGNVCHGRLPAAHISCLCRDSVTLSYFSGQIAVEKCQGGLHIRHYPQHSDSAGQNAESHYAKETDRHIKIAAFLSAHHTGTFLQRLNAADLIVIQQSRTKLR